MKEYSQWPRWLSVKAVARYLDLHPKSVYNLIYQGHIPATKIGGSIRIDRKKLDQLLESQETNFRVRMEEWEI
ncbi:MAG: helix-turn-helix domain-containing protein [Promethearchaeota archaeon]